MEFGKVGGDILPKINFRLPEEDVRSWLQMSRRTIGFNSPSEHFHFHLGCPAWGTKAWIGKVYPKGTPAADFLHHYSRQFSTIELNTTHYRIPDTATILKWRDATHDGFRFSPKFPQAISHGKGLSLTQAITNEFVTQIMKLENRLGMSFLQLPPHFAPRDLPELKRFLSFLPADFQLAVDVRHPAFFIEHQLIAPLFDLLNSTETSAVILDVTGRRDVLHLSLPTNRCMIRFIGNELHSTDASRMQEWSERVVSWHKLGLREMYFFMHQPDDVLAPEAVRHMAHVLNRQFEASSPQALRAPVQSWSPIEPGSLTESSADSTAPLTSEESDQLGFRLE